MTSRWSLLLAAVAAILVGSVLPAGATTYLHELGRQPFAHTREEAMRPEVRRNMFRRLGFPADVVEKFMVATESPGERIELVDGDQFNHMAFAGGVTKTDVVLVLKPGETYPAERWQVIGNDGEMYVVVLPDACRNWASQLPSCYRIYFDYTERKDVLLDQSNDAWVTAHLDYSYEEWERIREHRCFGVHDSIGRRAITDCDIACPNGEYPPPELARAVGLPEVEPQARFSFPLRGGKGYISFPREVWVAKLHVYCVLVATYFVSHTGYERWRSTSRFDVVSPEEIRKTLHKGSLPRVLSGEGRF